MMTQTVATIGPIELSEKTDNMNARAATQINPSAAKQNAKAYRHITSSTSITFSCSSRGTPNDSTPKIAMLTNNASTATHINNSMV